MAQEGKLVSEQQSPQVGDVLLHARPGRLLDQPSPIPGTGWIEATKGCDLVLTDASLYAQFISGPPHPVVGSPPRDVDPNVGGTGPGEVSCIGGVAPSLVPGRPPKGA